MSTELNSIKGKFEVPIPHTKESEYKDGFLHLTSFFGGENRGHSLQLTINNSHIQLSKPQVLQLIKELVNTYL